MSISKLQSLNNNSTFSINNTQMVAVATLRHLIQLDINQDITRFKDPLALTMIMSPRKEMIAEVTVDQGITPNQVLLEFQLNVSVARPILLQEN